VSGYNNLSAALNYDYASLMQAQPQSGSKLAQLDGNLSSDVIKGAHGAKYTGAYRHTEKTSERRERYNT
jgi:hypothetical protein